MDSHGGRNMAPTFSRPEVAYACFTRGHHSIAKKNHVFRKVPRADVVVFVVLADV